MNFLSKLQGYRTVIINAAAALAAAFFGHDAVAAIQNLGLSFDSAVSALVSLYGAGNVALRFFTTSPVFSGPVHVVTTPVVIGDTPTVTKH